MYGCAAQEVNGPGRPRDLGSCRTSGGASGRLRAPRRGRGRERGRRRWRRSSGSVRSLISEATSACLLSVWLVDQPWLGPTSDDHVTGEGRTRAERGQNELGLRLAGWQKKGRQSIGRGGKGDGDGDAVVVTSEAEWKRGERAPIQHSCTHLLYLGSLGNCTCLCYAGVHVDYLVYLDYLGTWAGWIGLGRVGLDGGCAVRSPWNSLGSNQHSNFLPVGCNPWTCRWKA